MIADMKLKPEISVSWSKAVTAEMASSLRHALF